MDYFHCPNCKTVVPCPYITTGSGRLCPLCPSCGVRMGIVSNNMAGTQGITGSNIFAAGGFGRGGGLGLGPGGYLVCPNCGTVMYRQLPAYLPTAFNNPTGNQNIQSAQSGTQTNAPPITSNAVMPHEYRGVCSKCHQITNFNSQAGSYQPGGYSNYSSQRPYRIGPGGCIIR